MEHVKITDHPNRTFNNKIESLVFLFIIHFHLQVTERIQKVDSNIAI